MLVVSKIGPQNSRGLAEALLSQGQLLATIKFRTGEAAILSIFSSLNAHSRRGIVNAFERSRFRCSENAEKLIRWLADCVN